MHVQSACEPHHPKVEDIKCFEHGVIKIHGKIIFDCNHTDNANLGEQVLCIGLIVCVILMCKLDTPYGVVLLHTVI